MLPSGVAGAWGRLGHILLTERAVDALPRKLRSFFAPHQEFLGAHSLDPDLWRAAAREERPIDARLCQPATGAAALEGGEDPRHYLDADLVAPYPFNGISRDFAEYRAGAGEKLSDWGTLPWTIAAYTDQLAQAMAAPQPDSKAIVCLASVLSHYVGDASQPFHLTGNYDGQLSGQRGIHRRFESDLVEAYALPLRRQIELRADLGVGVSNPIDGAFDMLISGHPWVDQILLADRRSLTEWPLAEGGLAADNPGYLRAMWGRTSEVAAERLAFGATMVASFWVTAWEQAGRPILLQD